MMISGLGDMLAKYVSICEWRISNIINGEYYCEDIMMQIKEHASRFNASSKQPFYVELSVGVHEFVCDKEIKF